MKIEAIGGGVIEMRSDSVGRTPDGNEVRAETDSAGPQVVVRGEKTHLLSRRLPSHKAAIELGKRVVEEGPSVYKDWCDLNTASVGTQLFRVFAGL